MMYNPDTMYKMARLEHEARIASARQAVEAREARRESGRSWFASVTGFLRPARSSDAAATSVLRDASQLRCDAPQDNVSF